jgi:carbonic anhydrase
MKGIVENSPEQAMLRLTLGNNEYISSKNNADVLQYLRDSTAVNEQNPYAIILTCSDSRINPEYIFSAGIGDLFIIRTAGNVVSPFDIGSIEYAVKYLGTKVIVVMGHSLCGAVAAAYNGMHLDGHVADIIDEILPGISGAADAVEAENLNIAHSYERVLESAIVRELKEANKIIVVKAKYDLRSGRVDFFE